MLESAELRPGKAFVFSFGKVKDDASPQVHSFVMFRIVSSISMICSTAHWLQSSTK